MAIIDRQTRFEWQTALTATRVSTDKYDLGVALRDIGSVEHLWLVGVVYTALTSGGSSTLTADLVGDDNASLSSPTTLMNLMPSTAKASLVAGYTMFKTRLPVGKFTERYFGINWTVGTTDFTAGAISAFMTPNIDDQRYYPRGYVNY